MWTSLITELPYMAIQSKNALDFSLIFCLFFVRRKMEKLRNRIFPICFPGEFSPFALSLVGVSLVGFRG